MTGVTDEPALWLGSESLLSKWGFSDGDPFEAITEWFHDVHGIGLMNHCDCDRFDLGVPDDELLRLLVRRHLLPALDQRVEVVDPETSHNPIRAERVDGVDVTGCWYGDQPRPTLTPDGVSVPYAQVLEAVRSLATAGRRSSL